MPDDKRNGSHEEWELPEGVRRTALWRRVAARASYVSVVQEIRRKAEVLARRTATAMPEYTDHTVLHMDRLWSVASQVLTESETRALTPSEAFLLAASFYIHDLGMALPGTPGGKGLVLRSPEFEAARRRFANIATAPEAEELAVREATRQLHAREAADLVNKPLPGLNEDYLISDPDFRDCWGHALGELSESHHWDLDQIERTLGPRKAAPGPDGYPVDYAYVACLLGVVDFAHISRDRAPRLERALRVGLPAESSTHWAAQANITGPLRDGDLLAYSCTKPIEDVDAWWLFYDLASELDRQTRAVREYLDGRAISAGRFSLQGVRGAETPRAFSQCVRLREGVVPIDIRVQPDSMERVVELLGGRRIYGRDRWAPLRELIQNARDAVSLRTALENARGRVSAPGEISVSVEPDGERWALRVSDNGVGMTPYVIRKFLLGVGSDFWHSALFYRDFASALDAGFRPIGKFGIGFLSVFMLGDRVEVTTETALGQRSRLRLLGLGRRGELSQEAATGHCGTDVRVFLSEGASGLAENLFDIVRARAPMLGVPVVVTSCARGKGAAERIEPGWWREQPQAALRSFVENWWPVAHLGGGKPTDRYEAEQAYWARASLYQKYGYRDRFGGKWAVHGWPGPMPEWSDQGKRLVSMGGLAPSGVIRCSQGVAVDLVEVPDVIGLVDVGPVELTVSRRAVAAPEANGWGRRAEERDPLAMSLLNEMRPAVVEGIDHLAEHGMMPGRIDFLRGLATIYGSEVIEGSGLAWIPVTLPPGDLIHHTRGQFVDVARKHGSLILCTGVTAAGAYGAVTAGVVGPEPGMVPLVAIRTEEARVQYDTERKLEHAGRGDSLKGTLGEVLSEGNIDESDLVLTSFLLRCLAEAWSVGVEDLRSQRWNLLYKSNVLWASLRSSAQAG